MPTIINAYGANDSIANSLRTLGEGIFGNGAKDEHARQSALSVAADVARKGREAAATASLADALSQGDFTRATRSGVLSGRSPSDVAGYGQYYGVNKYGPASEEGTRATMAVPGARYGNTVQGEREGLANTAGIAAAGNASHEKIAGMQTERQVQQQQWTDTHTFVPLQSPDGTRIINVPKSEVAGLQSQGYQVAPSTDQVKARLIAPSQPAPTQAAALAPVTSTAPIATAPPTAPSATTGGLSNLTQDQRSLVGLPTGTQHFIDPKSGDVAVSHDGGQTLTMPNGQRMPAMGSGFQPVDSAAALAQVRANNMRNEVHATPTPSLDYTNSAVSQDAYKASGLDATATRELNNSVGSVLGPIIGEIGAPTQRATARLTSAVNTARTALLSNEFRQTKYSQQQIDNMLPVGRGYANPATAQHDIGAVLRELGMEEAHLRQVIESPNTPIDLKHKAFAAWQQTHRAITLFTAPIEPQQPAAAAPAAAPAAAAPAAPAAAPDAAPAAPGMGGLQPGQTTVINGVTITRNN